VLFRSGDHDALWFEGVWHRSGELHERATRLAGALRERGVRPGDRVVVLMANCPEVGIAYNAIWRIVITRLGQHEPRTVAYMQRRLAEGKSKRPDLLASRSSHSRCPRRSQR
jgi:acyl-coenzyme A synthetase/AMP-(fatty) acid ligase